MDTNAFDELSKALATGTISRRTIVRHSVRLGAAAGAGFLGLRATTQPALAGGRQGNPTQPGPGQSNETNWTCAWTASMGRETDTLTAASSADDLSLTLTTVREPSQPGVPVVNGTPIVNGTAINGTMINATVLAPLTPAGTGAATPTPYARTPGRTTSHLVIVHTDSPASPLLQVDSVTESTGSIQITLTYGSGFQGVQKAVISSSDGKTATAVIDGKATRPYQFGNTGSVVFADGSALPKLTGDPGLLAAIERLLQVGAQAASSCVPSGHGAPSTGILGSLGDVALTPMLSGLPSVGVVSDACIGCDDGCGKSYEIAFLGGLATCAFTFGIGCGAAASALAEYYACKGVCRAPGNSCCPVWCPGGDALCCGDGYMCTRYRDSFERCCPAAQYCNGECCFSNQECKGNICCDQGLGPACGSTCCPSPNQICADASIGLCCNQGEVNLGGQCCAQTNVCGNTCCVGSCANPTTSTCCPGFSKACGGSCCQGLNDVCTGGVCCPMERACGNVCCSSSQTCTDPGSGTCGQSSCPPGQEHPLCQSDAGVMLQRSTSICCSPSVNCCAGKCCAPAQLCCYDGGVWQCSDNCLH